MEESKTWELLTKRRDALTRRSKRIEFEAKIQVLRFEIELREIFIEDAELELEALELQEQETQQLAPLRISTPDIEALDDQLGDKVSSSINEVFEAKAVRGH